MIGVGEGGASAAAELLSAIDAAVDAGVHAHEQGVGPRNEAVLKALNAAGYAVISARGLRSLMDAVGEGERAVACRT